MRVVDTTKTSVEFSAINVGECFLYDNCLFVKINPVKEEKYPSPCNAFCFADNNITAVPNNWVVIPVDAEVVVKNKGVFNNDT